ncbi:DUF402 domain-containing protein [Natronomonas sp. LN261]|uniref:DUF402 domain-containing protein n=1 Tax=Natronomonas sp. LN261 TaxID=2750669 RepID=UPI0015EF4685|nr:DUF402 domain-containing protein [Natronomonas sp. LN261]
MNVRVRGIYTTALTELLREDHDVVSASPPIRERFGEPFDVDVAGATVRTTDDREGIAVTGENEAVSDLRDRLAAIGRDTLAWDATAPPGSVFLAEVIDTLGSGAIVDLGSVDGTSVSGFLPYDRVDGYVEEGDSYRLQVAEAEPPWSDDRPTLARDLRIPGGLVELRRGDGGPMSETARLADILPVDPIDGWTPRWSHAADDASLDAMAAALDRANDRAERVMSAIASAEGEGPRRVVTPVSGAWLWFGRESRFELDSIRRRVSTTMAGHHRTKAATDAASSAVDFVEALCGPAAEDGNDETGFPFDVVTRQFGPQTGDSVAIRHGKPAGRTITLGRGEVTERDPGGSITVEREMSGGGTYDAIGVERTAGDVARTTFVEGRWWYATVYESAAGERRGTYVNVCTPVEIFPRAVRYVDLHVDVVKGPDGDVRRVDDDELDAAVVAGTVPEPLAARAREVAASIENVL